MIGAAFEICNEDGCGMAGEFYQDAINAELGLHAIQVVAQGELDGSFKEHLLTQSTAPTCWCLARS